jgi:7,8-dihydro-6-hydroxymethylpterin-pyrophosphokinase
VVNIPGIVVPHPRLHEREFVLVPLKEICPDKIHPVIKLAIRDLLNEVMK